MDLKKRITGNLLVVAATELVLGLLGSYFRDKINYLIAEKILLNSLPISNIIIIVFSLTALIPACLCPLYMRITRHESLRIFTSGAIKKRITAFFIGFGIGMASNALLCSIAWASGSFSLVFFIFHWMILLSLPLSFTIVLFEESLLRGYVVSFLEETHSWDVVAFTTGVLFIFHHVENMRLFGFNAIFCLNVFMVGIAIYLLIKSTGNFWAGVGFHGAWNYTQNNLFGLPNSGNIPFYTLLLGSDPVDSFFYDTKYGLEGCLMTTVFLATLITVLLVYCSRKTKDGVNLLNRKILGE